MSSASKDVRITLRLPQELHEVVLAFAGGDKHRPRASLNAALVFLIQSGLDKQQIGRVGGAPDTTRVAQEGDAGSAPFLAP